MKKAIIFKLIIFLLFFILFNFVFSFYAICQSLHITSIPTGANVYLDGEYYGQTPLRAQLYWDDPYKDRYFYGYCSVKLTKDGYKEYHEDLIMRSYYINIRAELVPYPPGKIHVGSIPASAKIFLDAGEYMGKTPLDLYDISIGNHKITLALDDYEEYSREIEIVSGWNKDIYAKLISTQPKLPACGSLKVNSSPDRAGVFLDDTFKGITPLTLNELKPGTYQLTLTKKDYQDYHKKVTIISSQVNSLSLDLEPISKAEPVYNQPPVDSSTQEKSPQIDLDLKRNSISDVIYLRNGDVITGTILNKNYNITTSYTQTKINNKMIKEIYLESGENNMSKILTINNNKISGFISNPIIVFKLNNGNRIEIRREKILKLVFRIDNEELQRISQSQSQFLILKNGDYFSGNILEKEFCIKTTYADIYCKLDKIKLITQIRGENPLTKVEMINGDLIQGILKTENINILLDIGPEVRIFQDYIDLIYCQEGFIPYEKLKLINITSDNENKFLKRNNGLEILELAENCSLRELGIEKGDILTNINGEKINSIEVLDFVLKEIVLGEREKAIIEIVRNNKEIFLDLLKVFE